jgi:hypothetical protein
MTAPNLSLARHCCNRCYHTWTGRFVNHTPLQCPNCRNGRWNKPRVRNIIRRTPPPTIAYPLPPRRPKCPRCEITGCILGCQACLKLFEAMQCQPQADDGPSNSPRKYSQV